MPLQYTDKERLVDHLPKYFVSWQNYYTKDAVRVDDVLLLVNMLDCACVGAVKQACDQCISSQT